MGQAHSQANHIIQTVSLGAPMKLLFANALPRIISLSCVLQEQKRGLACKPMRHCACLGKARNLISKIA